MQATVSRTANRMRGSTRRSASAPVRSSQVTARADPGEMSARVEDLHLSGRPSDNVEQTFTISNSHYYIGGSDPDHCDTAMTPVSGGAEVEVEVRIDGQQFAVEGTCIGVAAGFITSREKTLSVSHPLPSEQGVYSVEFIVRLSGSGEEIATFEETLTVDENSSAVPPDNDPDDNNNDDGGDSLVSPVTVLGGFGIVAALLFLA